MYCMHCGKQLPEEAQFCYHCGSPIQNPEKSGGKERTSSKKTGRWIICGIVLLAVVMLVVLLGSAKSHTPKDAEPAPQEVQEQAAEVEPSYEKPPQPSEPAILPEAEPEEIDPNSVCIPDLGDFFQKERSFEKGRGDVGFGYELKGFPEASREAVVEEVMALLTEPQYQLALEWQDSYHYEDEDTTCEYFYFTYTGTNPDIGEVWIDEANPSYIFKLSVFDLWASDGIFNLGVYFNRNFEETAAGKHTTQSVGEQFIKTDSGSGGVPDSSGLFDHTPPASKLKCLSCDGDGDCSTCGGSGYKGIGDAKGGCTTCRGNGKCRACGGSGTR